MVIAYLLSRAEWDALLDFELLARQMELQLELYYDFYVLRANF